MIGIANTHMLLTEVIQRVAAKEILDSNDTAENLLAVDVDVNDELFLSVAPARTDTGLEHLGEQDIQNDQRPSPEQKTDNLNLSAEFPQASGAVKRSGESIEGRDQPKQKIAKTTEAPSRPARATPTPTFFTPTPKSNASRSATNNSTAVKPKPSNKATTKPETKSTAPVDGPDAKSQLVIGVSRSASTARRLREEVKNGTFKPSAAKTQNFQDACREIDSDAANARLVRNGCQ